MASRSTVARYIADTLSSNDSAKRQKAITEAAAWLKTSGKSRQASYLAKDIEAALADNGYLFVTFTTARPVNDATRKLLKDYIVERTQAKTVECEFKVDAKLIGGVLITTPYGSLDASVQARLIKIVEGVYA